MNRPTLGRYTIIEPIGRGSMGTIYKGNDPRLDRVVALKVITPPTSATSPEETRAALDRLYLEARAAARVSHPAIVTVYDVGEEETDDGAVVYIAMEFLEGVSLDRWRVDETPQPVEALRVVRRLAEGLKAAHERGVTHHDVKPSNVILTVEGAKLTDFGLARFPEGEDASLVGKVVGTPAYMSPEQVEGGTTGPASDIFSLTVVLYQLLTDRLPFNGENVMGIMYNIVHTPPLLPSVAHEGLSPSFDAVILKGLAKSVNDRYATAEEFIEGIDLLLAEEEGKRRHDAGEGESFPTITYSVDDTPLARRIGPSLTKQGFPCHKSPSLPEEELAKHLCVALVKGEMTLVHFTSRTVHGSGMKVYTVADLIRAIRTFDRSAPTRRFVPLFITDATSRQQRDVMRLLGAYGVSYVIFLSPGDPAAEHDRQIGEALRDFAELLRDNFPAASDAPDTFDDEQVAPARHYEELLVIGSELMERGNLEEAIHAFTQALALNPDFDLLIRRGDAFYRSRNYVAALADYRKAQLLKASTPEPDAKIGACCLVMAKETKGTDPAESKRWFEKGVERLERSKETAARLEETYADEPEKLGGSPFTAILGALRSVEIGAHDFDDPGARLQTVIETAVDKSGEIDDDSVDTLLDRGVGLSSLGRFDEAETLFRTAFAANPAQAAPAYNNFAVSLRKQGHLQKAFESFARLAVVDVPERPRILKNMRTATMHYAHDLIKKGEAKEAEALYARAATLKMDKPEWTFLDLAMAHHHAGNPESARKYLKKGIALNPSLVSASRFDEYKAMAGLLYPGAAGSS